MTKIKITQVKSGIDRPERQKLTLRALGLKKLNASREVEATAQILGMVRKVNHLITIEEIAGGMESDAIKTQESELRNQPISTQIGRPEVSNKLVVPLPQQVEVTDRPITATQPQEAEIVNQSVISQPQQAEVRTEPVTATQPEEVELVNQSVISQPQQAEIRNEPVTATQPEEAEVSIFQHQLPSASTESLETSNSQKDTSEKSQPEAPATGLI